MGREEVRRKIFLRNCHFWAKNLQKMKIIEKLGVFLIFFMCQGGGIPGNCHFFSIRGGSNFALERGTRFWGVSLWASPPSPPLPMCGWKPLFWRFSSVLCNVFSTARWRPPLTNFRRLTPGEVTRCPPPDRLVGVEEAPDVPGRWSCWRATTNACFLASPNKPLTSLKSLWKGKKIDGRIRALKVQLRVEMY